MWAKKWLVVNTEPFVIGFEFVMVLEKLCSQPQGVCHEPHNFYGWMNFVMGVQFFYVEWKVCGLLKFLASRVKRFVVDTKTVFLNVLTKPERFVVGRNTLYLTPKCLLLSSNLGEKRYT